MDTGEGEGDSVFHLDPVAHRLAHPQFAQAVADFLEREGAGVASYIDELNERRPFKRT